MLIELIAALALWILWTNFAPQTTEFTVEEPDIPEAFNGFRITQISDLHDAQLGKEHYRLLNALKAAQPDVIVLTGDMVDSNRTDIDNTINFARQAVKIAPTYYVNGNHEALIPEQDYKTLINRLENSGVIVLEDECAAIWCGESCIQLIGLNDIGHLKVSGVDAKIEAMRQTLQKLLTENHGFSVVLSHRPELMDAYAQTTADLVLTGHAHGGQFRLPFIGGLIAPGQGLFPEYDSGLYTQNDTKMIVSRGIGNSVFPFRVNNRPELVIVELNKQE